MAYDHTTDPDAFLILDHRSNFWQDTAGTVPATTAGQTVARVDNVSASGLAYNAVAYSGSGTVTLGVDGNGLKYLVFANGATLKVPTSTAFDAEFVNTGNAGGNGIFVAFDGADGAQGFLVNKMGSAVTTPPGSNHSTVQVALFTGVNGYVQRYMNPGAVSRRPYAGGFSTGCVGNESGTVGPNPTATPNYRDGSSVYQDGAPAGHSYTNESQLDLTDSLSQDLTIGSWYVVPYTGAIKAVVCWNLAPRHHMVLATDRFYRAACGGPETLTNQPVALIWESNSESIDPNGPTEPGIADRVAAGLGSGVGASFNLARPGRKGTEIVYDYAVWAAPLIAYLQELGVPTAVHFWELINDGPGQPSTYPTYYGLTSGSGAKFSVQTAMSSSTYTSSLVGAGNTLANVNAQVLADAAANGYRVGLLGTDPASPMATYNASNYSDGTHWDSAGIALGYPYFLTTVAGSLAAPSTFTAVATAGPATASAAFTAAPPPGSTFTAVATAGPATASAVLVAAPPAISFRAALVAALQGSAAVSAVAGGNVFPLKVPQGASVPAVLWHVAKVDRLHDLDGATDVSTATVRIGLGSRAPADCFALSRAVRALFDGFTGDLSGVTVQETTSADEVDLYDPPADGSDDGVFWTVLDYRFRFLEPTP